MLSYYNIKTLKFVLYSGTIFPPSEWSWGQVGRGEKILANMLNLQELRVLSTPQSEKKIIIRQRVSRKKLKLLFSPYPDSLTCTYWIFTMEMLTKGVKYLLKNTRICSVTTKTILWHCYRHRAYEPQSQPNPTVLSPIQVQKKQCPSQKITKPN